VYFPTFASRDYPVAVAPRRQTAFALHALQQGFFRKLISAIEPR